jgi:hypothetical protein
MASKTLRERATEVGLKAMSKLFEDPRRAEAIARAVGGLQKAKQAIDEVQEKALKAAGLVTREDFKDAGRRLSALKRRCRDLAEELDQLLGDQKKPGPCRPGVAVRIEPPPRHRAHSSAVEHSLHTPLPLGPQFRRVREDRADWDEVGCGEHSTRVVRS